MLPKSIDPVLLAQALIRCPSITPAEGGALDLLESYLKPLGFSCTRLKFNEKGSEPVENLYARLGTESPHFCYVGHIDVVPTGDLKLWRHPPFEGVIEENILFGRGAVDMKGSIACFVTALSRFLTERSLSGSLSLLITGDEEGIALNGTQKVLEWLDEKGEGIDVCLVGEPTCVEKVGDTLKIGRRGSLSGVLTVQGKQGHTAYPQKADNPIPRLISCLQELLKGPEEAESASFPASNIEVTSIDVGNLALNVIPYSAQAKFNIRFNDQHTSSSIKEWIQKTCATYAQKFTLEFYPPSEPYLTKPGFLSDLVQKAILEEGGWVPQLSTTGGTSDARFMAQRAPVIEFGLVGETLHQIDEHVPLQDLYTLTNIYERLLKKFFPL